MGEFVMELALGKSYVTKDGRKFGPMVGDGAEWFTDASRGKLWNRYTGERMIRNGGADDLIAEWSEAPTSPVAVETVTTTRKRIVPGVYGRLNITGSMSNCVEVGFDRHINGTGVLTASELRAAAATLIELADALESPNV